MKHSFLLIITIFVFGCQYSKVKQEEPVNALPVITLRPPGKNIAKNGIKLSTIGTGFEYLKLETTKKSLLGNGTRFAINFLITPKYIYSDRKKFLRKNGSFVREMGGYGKGPGEYIRFFSMDIDTTNYNYIVLSNRFELLIYSDENTFLKEFTMPDKNMINIKYLYNDRIAFIRDRTDIIAPYVGLEIVNLKDGKIIKKYGNEAFTQILYNTNVQFGRYFGVSQAHTWEGNGKNYFYDPISDTISILTDDGIKPFAFLDLGKFNPSLDVVVNNDEYTEKRNVLINIRLISQIGTSLYITYSLGDLNYNAVYDYEDKSMETHQLPDWLFENDINILPVYNLYKVPGEECYYFYMDALELVTNILPKLKAMEYSSMSEENRKLYNVIKDMKIDDNPMLCFFR